MPQAKRAQACILHGVALLSKRVGNLQPRSRFKRLGSSGWASRIWSLFNEGLWTLKPAGHSLNPKNKVCRTLKGSVTDVETDVDGCRM